MPDIDIVQLIVN